MHLVFSVFVEPEEKEDQVELFSRPSLNQLKSMFSVSKKKVAVIRSVAPWWKDIGKHLGYSEPILNAIKKRECGKGDEACCEALFQLWLEGNEASWYLLLDALESVKFIDLAQDIRSCLPTAFKCEFSLCLAFSLMHEAALHPVHEGLYIQPKWDNRAPAIAPSFVFFIRHSCHESSIVCMWST